MKLRIITSTEIASDRQANKWLLCNEIFRNSTVEKNKLAQKKEFVID